jgi:hypothetical protein
VFLGCTGAPSYPRAADGITAQLGCVELLAPEAAFLPRSRKASFLLVSGTTFQLVSEATSASVGLGSRILLLLVSEASRISVGFGRQPHAACRMSVGLCPPLPTRQAGGLCKKPRVAPPPPELGGRFEPTTRQKLQKHDPPPSPSDPPPSLPAPRRANPRLHTHTSHDIRYTHLHTHPGRRGQAGVATIRRSPDN